MWAANGSTFSLFTIDQFGHSLVGIVRQGVSGTTPLAGRSNALGRLLVGGEIDGSMEMAM